MYADGNTELLEHSDALFGDSPEGSSVIGRLYYPNVTTGANSTTGCSMGSYAGIPDGSVVLVDRGSCAFSLKVLNAQRAGAVGVIVADNTWLCGLDVDECSDYACRGCPWGVQVTPSCSCDLRFMGDDGSGASVSIPSMLIGQSDGEVVKSRLASGEGVLVSMVWDLPVSSGAVEMSLFTHAEDANAQAYRSAFEPYLPYLLGGGAGAVEASPITPRLAFTPHFYIYDGAKLGCGTVFDCSTQCVNNQLYCSMDPDGDINAGISGAMVVTENLRQICVWQHLLSKAQPSPMPPGPTPSPGASPTPLPAAIASATLSWWAYADLFLANCNTPVLFPTQQCAEMQMALVSMAATGMLPTPSPSPSAAAAGASLAPPAPSVSPVPGRGVINPALMSAGIPFMAIDSNAVQTCMELSNSPVNASAGIYINALLQLELDTLEQMAIVTLPSVVINDVLLRGSITAANTLSAICNGFGHFPAPTVCQCKGVPPAGLQDCVAQASGANSGGGSNPSGGGASGGSGMPSWAAALISVFVIGVVLTIGVVCYLQRRSRKQVRACLQLLLGGRFVHLPVLAVEIAWESQATR
jgi:hypothetical protein